MTNIIVIATIYSLWALYIVVSILNSVVYFLMNQVTFIKVKDETRDMTNLVTRIIVWTIQLFTALGLLSLFCYQGMRVLQQEREAQLSGTEQYCMFNDCASGKSKPKTLPDTCPPSTRVQDEISFPETGEDQLTETNSSFIKSELSNESENTKFLNFIIESVCIKKKKVDEGGSKRTNGSVNSYLEV